MTNEFDKIYQKLSQYLNKFNDILK